MSEATEILRQAEARAAQREAERKPIDYARMQKLFPKQKAALTRAVNSRDLEKIILTCRNTIREWDEVGAWPDSWANWQRALDDALPWNRRVDLRDL